MGARWFAVGCWLGALGVSLGAFGAHGLKKSVSSEMIAVWETAARYHLVHALALLATGWAAERWPGALTTGAGWLFLAGIVVFSGSLYALALTGTRALGAITPFGGLCLIAGWSCLALAAMRAR
jgi:uncharacterized membrane protein YgdD (TMEM256/DUF423 family)